ncbi:MAG: DNA phosphorothioation system sulfurtransferase DndC [Desulfobacterales bacterium]|nr:DNA phosphorothioation system sulfurtransferase DndC [Desulfobacterales bacterium]
MKKAKTQNNACCQSDSIFSEEYLESLYSRVQKIYLADSRPWVIGFSGGKDSTVTLQVVWTSLQRLPTEQLNKKVFIISSDTFVETPVIVDYLHRTLDKLNQAASQQSLPFEAHKVTPQIGDTFWANLIGRGYPAPYSKFRWCTDRLKIEPANRFITDKVATFGEVVVVLGARRTESASRAGNMNKRKRVGEYLTRHGELPNAWVLTPIEDWYTEEVWEYLLSHPSPWGDDNSELLTMYKNAQDGECPLVIDKTTPPCGNSRFGCWTCTVVKADISMTSMIKKGEEWMQPLLDFRDWLAATQDPDGKKKIRDFRRRTGKVQYRNVDGTQKLIWGPYLFDFRKEILRRLLETEKSVREHGPDPTVTLISKEELLEIRRIWFFEEGDWLDTLPQVYHQVTGDHLEVHTDDWSGMGGTEFQVLKDVCQEYDLPIGLLTELFDAEKRQYGMSRRSAIFTNIESVLKKDWRSREEVFAEAGIEE